MNLDGKVKAKLLILFLITMFSATSVAHGTESSGNASGKADGTISCPDGKSDKGELSFSAFKKDAPIYGSWEVVVDDSSHDVLCVNLLHVVFGLLFNRFTHHFSPR